MKRIASIFLLALVLYNAFGYYLLFAHEREQARIFSLQNTPESAFQVIKYKAAIYASVADSEFEYVNEEMEIEGKTFHIVKKQVQNDTLCLYYFHNFRQDELRQSLNEIVENQTIQKQTTDNAPIKQLLKKFLKDYIPHEAYSLCFENLPADTEGGYLNTRTKNFTTRTRPPFHPPPPEIG